MSISRIFEFLTACQKSNSCACAKTWLCSFNFFSLAVMKFCKAVLRATPAFPTQTFFRLRINTFLVEKPFCFSTKGLHFVACWFSFTLSWNNRVKIKLRSDAFLKFLLKIPLRRETNLMQACSANQQQSALVIKKNALFLSQSAFSNFDPHLINKLISLTPNSTSGLPVPRYIFPLVLLVVEDLKTEKISFVSTLSYWFIFLFSFPLGTYSTLNQPLSNYLDNLLVKLFIFALNTAILFHGQDIHARIAFRRRVKDIEISFVNTLSS